jgi:hypothetical protein
MGEDAYCIGTSSIAIGKDSVSNFRALALGQLANTTASYAMAIGYNAQATAAGAVALGDVVTAATANTVSVKALEVQTDSTPTAGGIIMSDAGGIDRRINIDATGGLQIDSTPVGGGGAAGLVAGTGADSMESSDALTTTPANASGERAIALGEGVIASAYGNTAIGDSANASGTGFATAIGRLTNATGISATSVGNNASATGGHSVAIGSSATATAINSTAIGASVTAAIADTVSISALEVQTDSTPTAGGIIMADAGGTDRRINIDATGALQIDSTPVGGGGAAGLVNGTGEDTLVSAASLTTTPAVATDTGSIALGEGASSTGLASIAIGSGAVSSGAFYGISIGRNSAGGAGTAVGWGTQCSSFARSSAFGAEADALGAGATAIGGAANASGANSVSLGESSVASASGATALGAFVTAAIVDTASVKELETQTVGGGITMYSPNGTGYKLTVSDAGAPVFTAI